MSDTLLYNDDIGSLKNEASVRDFFELLKPRVMALVVFTGIAGIFLSPNEINPFLSFVAVLCIAIGAGAAGAINMWYERDIDAIMSRTKNRPIPKGRINPDDAFAFGMLLTLMSVALMALALNWVAAGLLAFASFFYIFIYTIWLKPRTSQNIVIGGAAGAFPPMIGWAAVTGSISIEPLLLFAIIFLWTPPHFWSLALYKNADYKKAKIPMLPVVAGKSVTRLQILLYTLFLSPFVIAPYLMGISGFIYLSAAILLQSLFISSAFISWKEKTDKAARVTFLYSIFYLFAIFAFMMIDKF